MRQRGQIELRGVGKRFGPAWVLRGIELTVAAGEFVVVVGPSGCGKSTLLGLVGGMGRADEGAVEVDGHAVAGPGPDRTVVFQDHALFPWLDAVGNVEFGLRMAGVARAERRARAMAALSAVHLEGSAGKRVHELSGGMRQRVAIARALVMDPAVLLMDEPFAALDAQTRTLMHHEVQELWLATGKTVLFVTHSVGEAVRLADRIVVMGGGRVRREVNVGLSHPRRFDSPEVAELMRRVRAEIDDEVNAARARELGVAYVPAGGLAEEVAFAEGI